MDVCLWISLSLLLSAGGLFLICLLHGKLVTPVRSAKGACLHAVVAASGSPDNLEHTVDGLLWLIRSGKLCCDILIVDAGLDEESRAMVRLLARNEPRIHLCGESICFTEDAWRKIEA